MIFEQKKAEELFYLEERVSKEEYPMEKENELLSEDGRSNWCQEILNELLTVYFFIPR